ncbi:hypothetical protein B0H63DRAFT_58184 [Podospora didyma]|uniref:Zn(2)-C6 fungal-type domain-containing protein n=1 Tax=Podospora didyma TaxID=330526 RepID=A0AAE0P7G7_9PEZI|nr:hypothetical protein B0H63DRAFT_58184 [Podospora didyma]
MSGYVQDPDQPLRHACDRCHSQKLRCPRSVDSNKANPDEPCSRCRKAGMACIVSLRGKAGRPSKVDKKKAARSSASSQAVRSPDREFPVDQSWGQEAEDHLISVLDGSRATMSSPGMADDVDMEQAPSQHPATHFSAAHGNYPHSIAASETACRAADELDHPGFDDPFLMDFDTGLDLPTFYISHNAITDGLEPTGNMLQPPIIPRMEGTIAIDPSLTDMLSKPSSLQQKQQQRKRHPSPVAEAPGPQFCSTTCYQKLSDLNARILVSFAKTESTHDSQIIKDVVGFCGELIDTARATTAYFAGSSAAGSRSRASTMSRAESFGEQPSSGASSRRNSEWQVMLNNGHSEPPPFSHNDQSVPGSAIIFLLLGCYTQILRLFEVTTNRLWARYHNAGSDSSSSSSSICGNNTNSSMQQDGGDLGTVSPLLEAALAVHTVAYLLSRLNRSFTVDSDQPQPAANKSSGNTNSIGTPVDDICDLQSWKRSFLGGSGKESDDGLLGQAFGEISERVQWLMMKTQHLQQRIN